MKIIYKNDNVEQQCTREKEAKKLFGGDEKLATKLLGRVWSLECTTSLKEVGMNPIFHLHPLYNKKRKKLKGFFAIDVDGRKSKWRIILRPLDENEEPYIDYRIDEKSETIRTIEIAEVSKHYE